MARTNTQHENDEQAPVGLNPLHLPDNAIYMSVDGYIGFLPMVNYDHLSSAENTAVNERRRYIAQRKAQTVAANAAKATPGDHTAIRAAIQRFLDTFEPGEETNFQTVAGKRAEIARDLLRERLKAAGKPYADNNVEHNLPAFMAHPRHAASIAEELAQWATAYNPPKPRGKGAGSTQVEDTNVDEL